MLLEARNLTVSYGMVRALEDVSFAIKEGEIVAMIGPNGAGKSTALMAVSGILKTTGGRIEAGEILFEGKNIQGDRPDELAGKGMSLVPEGRRVFPTMTVRENLEMGAYTRTDKQGVRDDIEKIFELFSQLNERANQKAGALSTGEQQMLALGRGLMLRPKLLLADEPSLGLSPNFVDLIFEKLMEINRNGTTLLLVEQNAHMALEVCHRGYVFKSGRIALEGDKDALMQDAEIKEVFLGG